MTEERKRYLDDLAKQLLMLDLKEYEYVNEKFEEGIDEIVRNLSELPIINADALN